MHVIGYTVSDRDYGDITLKWDAANKRRLELIGFLKERALTYEEIYELDNLQRLASIRRELMFLPDVYWLPEGDIKWFKKQKFSIS